MGMYNTPEGRFKLFHSRAIDLLAWHTTPLRKMCIAGTGDIE